eukprot:GFKZ01011318.1.p1 GENE.GFKZ01011318.1~~GFKZ01011318.1.p1  ORF type:complete len:401 (+),score=91.21 GFKZ01011318.1:227-1429(+)
MASSSVPPDTTRSHQAPACLVLGMAGSGKTTLVDALSAWLSDDTDLPTPPQSPPPHHTSSSSTSIPVEQPPSGAYVVNLDPAVQSLPYEPNVDIRDTLKYKDVMKDYSLGPNGAIITSLNLYATRFDQVLSLVERRSKEVRAILFDTPGQIETFTWSASGTIITDALAFSIPTVVLFVVDTERSRSAMTFVSNMLYACSVMYKTNLPMVIVFNKIDVESCKFAQAWMEDFDAFDAALKEDNFVGTLARSMAMALEEFYKNMRSVGVSAFTSEGMDQLVEAIKDAANEYEKDYRPALEERKRIRQEEEEERRKNQMGQFQQDRGNERDTKWAPKVAGPYGEDDDEEKEREEEDEERPLSARVHDARLEKMKGMQIDEKEDKKAYEELVKRIDGLKTSKSGS